MLFIGCTVNLRVKNFVRSQKTEVGSFPRTILSPFKWMFDCSLNLPVMVVVNIIQFLFKETSDFRIPSSDLLKAEFHPIRGRTVLLKLSFQQFRMLSIYLNNKLAKKSISPGKPTTGIIGWIVLVK